jgi:hypothetical protein
MYWASTSCAQRIYYPHTSLLQTRYISWLGYQLRRAYGYGFPRINLLGGSSHPMIGSPDTPLRFRPGQSPLTPSLYRGPPAGGKDGGRERSARGENEDDAGDRAPLRGHHETQDRLLCEVRRRRWRRLVLECDCGARLILEGGGDLRRWGRLNLGCGTCRGPVPFGVLLLDAC